LCTNLKISRTFLNFSLSVLTYFCIFLVMKTKLTIPIAAKNLSQAGQQIASAIAAGAEMLELRTDFLENPSVDLVKKLIAETKNITSLPIITTCRCLGQGGAIAHPEKLRVEVLIAALDAGSEFIDFEYENFSTENKKTIVPALSRNPKAKLILSTHNFKAKFDNINKLYKEVKSSFPAAVAKLVYTANHINDCFDTFDLLHNTKDDLIVFCMGDAGLMSRIIAKKLNGLVTFASLHEKTATAPGQLTIEQFKDLYRYDQIDDNTELYGIIGSPVAHSLSPAVHNACFAGIKANKLYLPLLIEGDKPQFDIFLKNILDRPWLNFKGFSVTIPHKQNALDFVRDNNGFIESLTRKIGAANTIIINESQITACNTDYAGALDAIIAALGISRTGLKGLPVAVLGAGGAARAIVAGLSDAGAKIIIYNRTVEKGMKLAAEFDCQFASLDNISKLNAKLLINCTSIGMHPDINSTPVPKNYLKKDLAVFDTVYNPAETLLLKQAKEIGAKTITGIDMFINQAAAQFKLFTGKPADTNLMRKTISDCLFH
jgi:3-dehydroquinate dehydratase / shikimate dehydrogenase